MASHPHRLLPDAALGFQPVFLTFCTYRRQRLFVHDDLVELVRQRFLQACEAEQFELLAFCFMPDHFHALVTGVAPQSDLHAFVKRAKQLTGFHARKLLGSRLWQDSYFDRSLRAQESIQSTIRYLVNNPVRAGLVESPDDYPFWGSQTYSRAEILEFLLEPRT